MKTLRKNLIHELKIRDWNAYDLADRSGVAQPTIFRIISGSGCEPRSSTITKIADGLNISEAKLRGFAEAQPKAIESTTNDIPPIPYETPSELETIIGARSKSLNESLAQIISASRKGKLSHDDESLLSFIASKFSSDRDSYQSHDTLMTGHDLVHQ